MDRVAADAGVGDGLAARIKGFPHLRVDRFLASYAPQAMSDAQLDEWITRLLALGNTAREYELANLPAHDVDTLERALAGLVMERAGLSEALSHCANRLTNADRGDPARRSTLKAEARVPRDYLEWQRIVGAYWITRIPFARGIRRWHREVQATFELPLEAVAIAGELKRYAPPPDALSPREVKALLDRTSANALGVPDPRGADLEVMFRTFAPVFVVDTNGRADLPGELGWGEETPRITSQRPVVYRRASHTRYHGRALLQLSYWIWFPERPKRAGSALLGGNLDGLLWRVTLAPDGSPWVFDTIHPCGCYHLFFPTARAVPIAQAETLDETAFVPQSLPPIAAGARTELWLESETHYVRRVVVAAGSTAPATRYAFLEDDALRSLPRPGGGRASIFRPDGIVPGSERGERWLFWPMGVPEPGAMRQWGRQPTAFVGRRHFDDSDLLERYFLLRDP